MRLYCEAIAAAATKGHREGVVDSGVDIGAMDVAPVEDVVAAEAAPAAEAPTMEEAAAAVPEVTEEETATEA